MPDARRPFAALLLLIFLMASQAGIARAAQRKKILVLHNFNQDHPAIAAFDQGLHEVLTAQDRYEVLVAMEYLNLTTFESDKTYLSETARYIAFKYTIWKPDIILLDTAVYDLYYDYLRQAFAGVPVEIAVDPDSQGQVALDTPHVVVTKEGSENDVERNIELVLRLRPGTRKIYVVVGTSVTEQRIARRVRALVERFAGRVSLVLTDNLSQSALLDTLSQAEPDSAIVYCRFALDADKIRFIPARVAHRICQVAPVPVFLMNSHLLGDGGVGGYCTSLFDAGRLMAREALKLLDGVPSEPRAVPLNADRGYVFDGRQLVRWGIAETSLPEGSRVLFKERTLWEQYRGYALVGLALIVGETALIAGLVANRTRRRRAEAELLSLNATLERRVQERTRALDDSNRALIQAKAELEALSRTDSLTGLANRRHAEGAIDEAFTRLQHLGTGFSVAMLDIDHFKLVNDVHGHEAGDQVLCRLADAMRDALRPGDLVSRWGGEEFLLLLPRAGEDDAVALGQRLRRRLAEVRHSWGDVVLVVTVTIGVAAAKPGDTPRELVGRADAALYRGKAAGRDRVERGA